MPAKQPKKIIDIHTHYRKDLAGGADRIVEIMDAAGVERILLLGTGPQSTEPILAAMKKHPGRLLGGVGLDPREGKAAIAEMERCRGEGFCFVKLFPNRGYYPDDEAFLPFFERAAKLKMGVLSHCGWLGTPKIKRVSSKYPNPVHFEVPAREFPEMPFIMAHMGGFNGIFEAIMLATRTANVYIDTTPGQPHWFFEHLPQVIGGIPPDKLLFGTDGIWEGVYDVEELPYQVEHLARCGHEKNFDKIFYENSAKILKELGAIV